MTLKAISGTAQSLTRSLLVFVSTRSSMVREHLDQMTGLSESRCCCKNAAQHRFTCLSRLSCKANTPFKRACSRLLVRPQKYKYHRAFMCLHDVNQQSSFLCIVNVRLFREACYFSPLILPYRLFSGLHYLNK